ncbi:MAG TPA: hypothetical protein DCS93_29005 [Microscillaceae bacterium]|nr:hypothetical protein [Microscillaceae bacterium]
MKSSRRFLFTLGLLGFMTFAAQAQSNHLEASLKKEIQTYQKSFTQKVIFDISRYFKFKRRVIPEITRYFRGIKVTRKESNNEPAYFEFLYKNKTLNLSESEVRKLVGLSPQFTYNYNKTPID